VVLTACSDAVGPGGIAPDHDLVFEGYFTATPELLVWDTQTGSVRRLLSEGIVVMDPQPSPDGTRVAFVVANYTDGTGDIFVVDRDGADVQQITFEPELDDQPAWSPDGQHIAFRSFRTQLLGDIWVVTSSGGNPTNLTPDPLPGVIDESHPNWSPDGTHIVYASNEGGDRDIWTMTAQGADKLRITATEDLDTEPTYSPDGATIAFRRSRQTLGSDIHLVPSGGGAATPLALAGEQRMPVWWPDGNGLVVVSHVTTYGRPDLYALSLDGTGSRPLVTSEVAGGSLNPAFLLRP